jgi:hypothetical protein
VFAGVAFVGDDEFAAVQSERQKAQSDFAFFLVGGARIAALGVPSGAASRCRRMPQNQREWLLQGPRYCAAIFASGDQVGASLVRESCARLPSKRAVK